MAEEKIIVSLTTWKPRFRNIPTVLDSIFAQTVPPDKVVLNLAEGEDLDEALETYLKEKAVEIFRLPDWKVYKKLIPTLRRYPQACVIAIDDDWLYPPQMIEDFMKVHAEHPSSPISGNKESFEGLNCHCGCASLVKAEYFGSYLNKIDEAVIATCPSDDIVYTFMAAKNGRFYEHSEGLYFENMEPVNQDNPYSPQFADPIIDSYNYLVNRFGAPGSDEHELDDEYCRQLYKRDTSSDEDSSSGAKLAVCINLTRANHIPAFIRRLSGIRCCPWDLYVYSLGEDHPAAGQLKAFRPDTHFVSAEPSVNGFRHFHKLLKSGALDRYDAVLHLDTLAQFNSPVVDAFNLGSRRYYNESVDALIATPEAFDKAMKALNGNDVVCSAACHTRRLSYSIFDDEAHSLYEAFKPGRLAPRFISGANFLCSVKALKALKSTDIPASLKLSGRMEAAAERYYFSKDARIKTIPIRNLSLLKRLGHFLFSMERYSPDSRKILFLCGFAITIDKGKKQAS